MIPEVEVSLRYFGGVYSDTKQATFYVHNGRNLWPVEKYVRMVADAQPGVYIIEDGNYWWQAVVVEITKLKDIQHEV